MKKLIKNNYKILMGILIGILLSVTTVYAIDAYIESKKISYDNKYTKKDNVQEAIDELYERSGIHQEKWIDPILNGADPILKEPLIPVEIKPNGDVYYANEKSEWYNYSEKRWANAVILVDNPSNEYGIGNEVNINNANDFSTGYSADVGTNQNIIESTNNSKAQSWNTSVGYLASTTGNINGVYDMSGGTWEYVAACIEGTVGNSDFDTKTLASEMQNGYIDKYDKSSTISSYNRRILGDATGELGPFYFYVENDGISYTHSSWYKDCAHFVDSDYPWFARGSGWMNGVLAGQFNFDRHLGGNASISFRIALALTN